jgi:hypothetical protein
MILNRPRPLICIGVGGLALQGNPFTSLILSGLLDLSRTRGHRSGRFRTSYRSQDRSDWCWWPVRPVCPAWSARCQFWVSTVTQLREMDEILLQETGVPGGSWSAVLIVEEADDQGSHKKIVWCTSSSTFVSSVGGFYFLMIVMVGGSCEFSDVVLTFSGL